MEPFENPIQVFTAKINACFLLEISQKTCNKMENRNISRKLPGVVLKKTGRKPTQPRKPAAMAQLLSFAVQLPAMSWKNSLDILRFVTDWDLQCIRLNKIVLSVY